MEAAWKEALEQQFGAALAMLENALRACPEELWADSSQRPEFWSVGYHALFYLDLYCSESLGGFAPPAPFTLDELDSAGRVPERPYTKAELLDYLEHGRRKCRAAIASLTDEKARERRVYPWLDVGAGELLFYTLRHVQHHAGQLNLLLRQSADSAPRWVARAPL